MSNPADSALSRRDLLATTTRTAVATAAVGALLPGAYAAGDETIQLALVGCGGRGSGAAVDAMSSSCGPTKLVAMADAYEDRLKGSYEGLQGRFEKQMDVPQERQFVGFDAYRQAMDALNPGDVVLLTTPPAFRWVQFKYAIEKGLNVFMEKPICVDAPSGRRMLELGEEAKKKNLKVGVGLMCRHCEARGQLYDRIQNGELGDLILLRAYRMVGPTASAFVLPKPPEQNELEYQIRNFHSFLWASGGAYSDFLIHNIDECCWMKNDWPVEAQASGGRHYRGDYVDQNFDTYSVEYTFGDGTKMRLEGRTMVNCKQEFASFAHGSKGSAVISQSGHAPSRARIFKDQRMTRSNVVWQFPQPEPNPYQLEWDHLLNAIREDKPYNEVERGAKASLVTVMGRMAAHTGRVVTWDDMLELDHEFAPDVDKLVVGGDAPLKADASGKYPVPAPGLITKREYQV
ncbi:MAG: Gfo/Idh/MocA family oxidoreductase [Planctomyces sp.]|nr:Gfo/Idh/MocA family oxidoreductase [Planctomyces sp.]